jgi:hypothetical protein
MEDGTYSFLFEYWFEMMSLTVILELIIFNMINGIDRNNVSQQ